MIGRYDGVESIQEANLCQHFSTNTIDVIRRSVRRGLVPILNSMVAVGLISIPGMMTGQILAGESPDVAARYQLFILFAIAGGVAIGTVGVVLAAEKLISKLTQKGYRRTRSSENMNVMATHESKAL